MVKYETLMNVIEDYTQKCTEYPKLVAMRDFDPSNFQEERYSENPRQIPSPQGLFQRIQEELQQEVKYTPLEMGALNDYKTNSYIPLNHWLNGGTLPTTEEERWYQFGFMGYMRGKDGQLLYGDDRRTEKGEFVMAVHNYPNGWREEGGHEYIDLSMPQEDRLIHRAIAKTPPLAQDTVLYSYRELPKDLQVGDHSKIKGYGSTSFNSHVIKDIEDNGPWVQDEKDRRYRVKIYAPKGTNGIVLNRENSGSSAWQSEWLLDKNQRYYVRSINHETMEAEIVLY